jgi:hypothetical protein
VCDARYMEKIYVRDRRKVIVWSRFVECHRDMFDHKLRLLSDLLLYPPEKYYFLTPHS